MKKERKDHQFIKKPYFEGGITAMKSFIKKHLSYPTPAQEKKIEGTVYVRYSINYKGKVIDAKIISGIGYGCDEEALRLAHLLNFVVPKNRNLKTIFHKDLQIHFRLPKSTPQKTITPPPTFNYTYTSSKKEDKPITLKKLKSKSYNIIIDFER